MSLHEVATEAFVSYQGTLRKRKSRLKQAIGRLVKKDQDLETQLKLQLKQLELDKVQGCLDRSKDKTEFVETVTNTVQNITRNNYDRLTQPQIVEKAIQAAKDKVEDTMNNPFNVNNNDTTDGSKKRKPSPSTPNVYFGTQRAATPSAAPPPRTGGLFTPPPNPFSPPATNTTNPSAADTAVSSGVVGGAAGAGTMSEALVSMMQTMPPMSPMPKAVADGTLQGIMEFQQSVQLNKRLEGLQIAGTGAAIAAQACLEVVQEIRSLPKGPAPSTFVDGAVGASSMGNAGVVPTAGSPPAPSTGNGDVAMGNTATSPWPAATTAASSTMGNGGGTSPWTAAASSTMGNGDGTSPWTAASSTVGNGGSNSPWTATSSTVGNGGSNSPWTPATTAAPSTMGNRGGNSPWHAAGTSPWPAASMDNCGMGNGGGTTMIPPFVYDGWKFDNQEQFTLLFLSLANEADSLLKDQKLLDGSQVLHRWMSWGITSHPKELSVTFDKVVNGAYGSNHSASVSQVMKWFNVPLPHDNNTNFTRVQEYIKGHVQQHFQVDAIVYCRPLLKPLFPVKIIAANGDLCTIDDGNGVTYVADLRQLQPNWKL